MKKVFLVSALFLFAILATPKIISAQVSCPSSKMDCPVLDLRGGCSSPCIKVVTKQGGPAGRGATTAQCQCQLTANEPGTVPLGLPCQKDSDCASPGKYCWGEFHSAPVCQELTRSESLEQRQQPGEQSTGPDPTCDNGQGINTAIGCIPITDPNLFIGFILRWAIGIGGGIAFLLIVYSAFMIMTSQGNPERLKAGQELLTSAIAGLIMLIFSVFILELIGVKILQIPGFSESPF